MNMHCFVMHICTRAGLGLAQDGSGYTMLTVLGRNHTYSPAQTTELVCTFVVMLRMWQSTAALVIHFSCLELILKQIILYDRVY